MTVIPLKFSNGLEPASLKLKAANGSPIKCYGKSKLNIVIRKLRRDFPWYCAVADVSYPILGADFLAHYDLWVSVKQGKLVDSKTKFVSACIKADISDHQSIFATYKDCPTAVEKLLEQFPNITQPFSATNPVTHNTKHYIETTGPPLASRPRPLHGPKLAAAKAEFEKLVSLGIVEPSKSPWSSPIHLVPKGEGYRVTGDYRRLNNRTTKDCYPMKNIASLTCLLHGKMVFSKLDLVRGYNQIPMEESSIPKTAVTTPFGLFQYTHMPYGLCNASQTFQRFMDELFGDLPYVFVYIDDVLIFSANEAEHLEHLKTVFEILSKNNLKIGIEKCSFLKNEIEFLGYNVCSTGIKPSTKKCVAISEIAPPETIGELRSFLGTIGFYRRHIYNFAEIAVPLHQRLAESSNKSHQIELTDSELEAFTILKMKLSEIVQHSYIDPASNTFVIKSDASLKAIGAVLYQVVNCEQKTILFFSRKLSDTETRYSTFDRELLAAKDAVECFLPYIDGQHVTLFTDHKPLVSAFVKKTDCKSERQSRHLTFLSEYLTAMEHIKGEDNVVADYLSRQGCATTNAITSAAVDLDAIANEQAKDNKELYNAKQMKAVQWYNKQIICEMSSGKMRPVVPASMRKDLIHQLHSIGHPGIKGTTRLISDRYFWPHMSNDIKEWCRACPTCQQQKVTTHTKAPWKELPHPSARFSTVHIDIVGPLPASTSEFSAGGTYRYILTAIDRYTRWLEAIPLVGISAEEVASAFVNTWVSRFGVPLEVITDRGTQLESGLFHHLSKKLGFIRLRTTAYNPKANGLVERQHRTLKTILRPHGNNWLDALPLALFAMRITPSSSTGVAPFTMVTGSYPLSPLSLLQKPEDVDDPHNFCRKLSSYMETISFSPPKWNCTQRINVPPALSSCAKVWLHVDRVRLPMEAPYAGPYDVVKRTENFFTVEMPSGRQENVSISRLKPFTDSKFAKVNGKNEEVRRKELFETSKKMEAKLVEEIQEGECDSDETDDTDNLDSVEKFKQKIPFQTRSGRTVKFSSSNNICWIEPHGKCKPTPKR